MNEKRTIATLLRQQAALANFGSFAFAESDLQKILSEASNICAKCLDVPFAKICRYRAAENDLLVEAGCGWHAGVVGNVVSPADESSTQGRAFVTGKAVILEDISKNHSYSLPPFYAEHGIVATADVPIKGNGEPWGVLEIDSPTARAFDQHDVDFLTGFANVIAEAVGSAKRTASLLAAIVEQEALVAEKDFLGRELNHRVRNNLQLILGMMNHEIELGSGRGTEGIRGIAQRVMSLAKVYDHLLGNGLSRTIDFGGYLESLCASLHDFQDAGKFEVSLTCKAEPMQLDLDLVTPLGLVVAELISNAFIHAFPERAGTIIVILQRKSTHATLTISDDGIGFIEPRLSKRHGLGLVRRLMEQIGGKVHVVSNHGTKLTLDFPMAVDALVPEAA
jgi:two-component sensor histidine kinase